jgi:hypothetical protein
LKPGQKIAPNLVLTRDPVGHRESASAYANRQLVEFAKRLDGFELQGRHERHLGGLPAVELTFTWHGTQGVLQQKQICVVVRGQTVLNFTLTTLKADYPQVEPTFNTILASLKFPEVLERTGTPGLANGRRY